MSVDEKVLSLAKVTVGWLLLLFLFMVFASTRLGRRIGVWDLVPVVVVILVIAYFMAGCTVIR